MHKKKGVVRTMTHEDALADAPLVDRPRQLLTRRQLVGGSLKVALGLPAFSGLLAVCSAAALAPATPVQAATPPAQATSTRPLTPTFYQWIVDLHPSLPQVNANFQNTTPLNFQIAPVQGFGIDRFVAEARDKNSTWDVYVGMTPFV